MIAKVMRVTRTQAINRYDLYHSTEQQGQSPYQQKPAKAEGFEAVLKRTLEKSPTTSVPYEVDISKQPILTYFSK